LQDQSESSAISIIESLTAQLKKRIKSDFQLWIHPKQNWHFTKNILCIKFS